MGQKNKIARRWARRGTRPRAPHDQRTSSVYIFGAICPQDAEKPGAVHKRTQNAAPAEKSFAEPSALRGPFRTP